MTTGEALKNVPIELRTEKLCKLAVSCNGMNIKHVPGKYITQEICDMAVESNHKVFPYIMQKYMTKAMCKKVLRYNSEYLEYIRGDHNEHNELIAELGLIDHVEPHLRTKYLCKLAFERDPNSIEFIPEKYVTQEMAETAVKHNGKNLKYVPIDMRTYDMCMSAAHDVTLDCIPIEFRDKTMMETGSWNTFAQNICQPLTSLMTLSQAKKLIDANPVITTYLPSKFEDNPDLLRFAAHKGFERPFRSWMERQEINNEIIEKYPEIVEFVNDGDIEKYRIALRKDGRLLRFVPENLVNHELCNIAVNSCGLALEYVPLSLRSIDLVLDAVRNDENALEFNPYKEDNAIFTAAFTR